MYHVTIVLNVPQWLLIVPRVKSITLNMVLCSLAPA